MPSNWPPDRTLFQEGRTRDPRCDLRTDAAIVYGIDQTLPDRVASWRARGYHVHLMTGLAWGRYQEYLLGRWDGMEHWEEAQYGASGRPKLHGPQIPYMAPTPSFALYLEGLLRQAIDAGVEAIFLEEPEFWSSTGYGPGFRSAWSRHHGFPWRDPATDPTAFVQGAQVKYALYHELVRRLCVAVKEYSQSRVPCYVATHSLLNYTAWAIVSPELSLRTIPEYDGAIVQVWSFTARSQTFYEGRKSERLLPVAYLEYGSGLELVRGTSRHLWFLADPVEDSPTYGWDRYRAGYEATVAASLFYPEVGAFEVMPWPTRVFTSRYPRRPDGPPGDLIPQAYASELLAIANALRTLPEGPIRWDCGTQGVGVLVADSMMFRRGGPGNDDPELSSFYGLALPLLLAGMPVRSIGMELLAGVGAPPGMHVLLLSYDGMTPPDAAAHMALALWVRAGGALLCFGAGDGPYETIDGWWNAGASGTGPWPDLFKRLGLSEAPAPGDYRVDAGVVVIESAGPIALARRGDGALLVRERLRAALTSLGPDAPPYHEQGFLAVRRGAYLVIATLAEGPAVTGEPLRLSGTFVNLFDCDLPVCKEIAVLPGSCALLIDLALLERAAPCIVAAAARVTDEHAGDGSWHGRASGPAETAAVLRLSLPAAPQRALVGGMPASMDWDVDSQTVVLRFPNVPEGVQVEVWW